MGQHHVVDQSTELWRLYRQLRDDGLQRRQRVQQVVRPTYRQLLFLNKRKHPVFPRLDVFAEHLWTQLGGGGIRFYDESASRITQGQRRTLLKQMRDILYPDRPHIQPMPMPIRQRLGHLERLCEPFPVHEPAHMIRLIPRPGTDNVFRADDEVQLLRRAGGRHQDVIVASVQVVIRQAERIEGHFFPLLGDDA